MRADGGTRVVCGDDSREKATRREMRGKSVAGTNVD